MTSLISETDRRLCWLTDECQLVISETVAVSHDGSFGLAPFPQTTVGSVGGAELIT